MKKHFLKVLACLMAVLFLSCEGDHASHQQEEGRLNKVNLEDLPEISEFIHSQKSLMARNASANLLDSIVTEGIVVLEREDGTKTYTFGLNIAELPTRMSNLIIDETMDGFEYYTLTYESENLHAWKQEVEQKQAITVPVEITKNNVDASLMSRGSGNCVVGASY